MRAHNADVRLCYERELARRPSLVGRVVVRFVISATGAVQAATIESSDLEAPAVDDCVIGAVRRWTFPEPEGGGIVAVTYPFLFQAE